MLGHAYIPTHVLDRRLDEELERCADLEIFTYKAGDDEDEMEHLKKAELFVRSSMATDMSNPLQQLLKVGRE